MDIETTQSDLDTSERLRATVARAINKFGEKTQVIVAMEELNELSACLAKYFRYPTNDEAVIATYPKVLEEFADVTIVIETLRMIYGFNDLNVMINKKLNRLERWLDNGDSIGVTTTDRKV